MTEAEISTPEPKFAPTLGVLADLLDVTRQTLRNWRTDPRFAGTVPQAKDDGRHDVEAWRNFISQHGLGGYDTPGKRGTRGSGAVGVAVGNPPLIEGTESDWRKMLIQQRVIGARIENEKLRGSLILAAELEGPLGAVLTAIQNFLVQLPDRAAPELVGYSTPQDMANALRQEIEAGQRGLNTVDFLDELPEIAAELFPEMDEEARAEVVALAAEALRRIGRAAITRALHPEKEELPELPDYEE